MADLIIAFIVIIRQWAKDNQISKVNLFLVAFIITFIIACIFSEFILAKHLSIGFLETMLINSGLGLFSAFLCVFLPTK